MNKKDVMVNPDACCFLYRHLAEVYPGVRMKLFLVTFLFIAGYSSSWAYDDEIVAKYKEIVRLRAKAVENAKKQEGLDPGIVESLELYLLKAKGELAEEQNDVAAQIRCLQESIEIMTKTRDRVRARAEGDETMGNLLINGDIGILQLEAELLKVRRRSEQPTESN